MQRCSRCGHPIKSILAKVMSEYGIDTTSMSIECFFDDYLVHTEIYTLTQRYRFAFLFYKIVDNAIRILHLPELREKYDWMNADDPCLCLECIDNYIEIRELFTINDSDGIIGGNIGMRCFFCSLNTETFLIQLMAESWNNMFYFPIYYYYIDVYENERYQRWYLRKYPDIIEPDITQICKDCLDILIHFDVIEISREIPESIPPNFTFCGFFYVDDVVYYLHEFFKLENSHYLQFYKQQHLRRSIFNPKLLPKTLAVINE